MRIAFQVLLYLYVDTWLIAWLLVLDPTMLPVATGRSPLTRGCNFRPLDSVESQEAQRCHSMHVRRMECFQRVQNGPCLDHNLVR